MTRKIPNRRSVLIVDGGSTKADWALCSDREAPVFYETGGLNPLLLSSNQMAEEIRDKVKADRPDAIMFYGASCSTPDRNKVVEQALQSAFPGAKIMVDHDLTGAARALLGSRPGIACILGTGSNCGYYDGRNLATRMRSLGYIMGDEGSGTDLAKSLMRGFFYETFPGSLRKKLRPHIPDDIVDRVHGSQKPNFELASYARVLSQFRSEPEIRDLIVNRFEEFIKLHLLKYKHLTSEAAFTGSVALHFKRELETALAKYGFSMYKCIEKPIFELIKYHTQNEEV